MLESEQIIWKLKKESFHNISLAKLRFDPGAMLSKVPLRLLKKLKSPTKVISQGRDAIFFAHQP